MFSFKTGKSSLLWCFVFINTPVTIHYTFIQLKTSINDALTLIRYATKDTAQDQLISFLYTYIYKLSQTKNKCIFNWF